MLVGSQQGVYAYITAILLPYKMAVSMQKYADHTHAGTRSISAWFPSNTTWIFAWESLSTSLRSKPLSTALATNVTQAARAGWGRLLWATMAAWAVMGLQLSCFLWLQRLRLLLFHSRLVCRVDKPKEVHDQPCSKTNNQIHAQNTHQPCRRQQDKESSI